MKNHGIIGVARMIDHIIWVDANAMNNDTELPSDASKTAAKYIGLKDLYF